MLGAGCAPRSIEKALAGPETNARYRPPTVSRYRRLLALLLPGLLPWAVVTWPSGYYLVVATGWSVRGLSGFRAIPWILASGSVGAPAVTPWLVGVLLYALALASAALALAGREDRRLTAGLLALAGVSVLLFAVRASGQRGILAVPVGVATLWAAAVYVYGGRAPWGSKQLAWLGGDE